MDRDRRASADDSSVKGDLAAIAAGLRGVESCIAELTRTLEAHLSVCKVLVRRHEDLEEVLAGAGAALESLDSRPLAWEQAIDLFVTAGRILRAPLADRVSWDEVISGTASAD